MKSMTRQRNLLMTIFISLDRIKIKHTRLYRYSQNKHNGVKKVYYLVDTKIVSNSCSLLISQPVKLKVTLESVAK